MHKFAALDNGAEDVIDDSLSFSPPLDYSLSCVAHARKRSLIR